MERVSNYYANQYTRESGEAWVGDYTEEDEFSVKYTPIQGYLCYRGKPIYARNPRVTITFCDFSCAESYIWGPVFFEFNDNYDKYYEELMNKFGVPKEFDDPIIIDDLVFNTNKKLSKYIIENGYEVVRDVIGFTVEEHELIKEVERLIEISDDSFFKIIDLLRIKYGEFRDRDGMGSLRNKRRMIKSGLFKEEDFKYL